MSQRQNNRASWDQVLLAVTLILLATAGYSQWRENGVEVEDTAWKKSSGDFSAMLMIADDPDGLFQAWNRPSSPDYGPSISEVSTAQRGDVVLGFVIFTGCDADSKGNCNSSVEYTAYFPDGRLYGHHEGEAWIGKQAPPHGQLQLSVGNLGLRIEEDDPLGVYKIEAVIVDHIAGSELKLVTELTVVKSD